MLGATAWSLKKWMILLHKNSNDCNAGFLVGYLVLQNSRGEGRKDSEKKLMFWVAAVSSLT